MMASSAAAAAQNSNAEGQTIGPSDSIVSVRRAVTEPHSAPSLSLRAAVAPHPPLQSSRVCVFVVMVSLRSLLLLVALAMCCAMVAASTADSDQLMEFDALLEVEAEAPVGEGASCTRSGIKGTCTAAACTGGTKFTGLCPGAANIQCCIKTVAKKATPAAAAAPAKAAASTPAKVSTPAPTSVANAGTGGKVTTTSIPYKFPYAQGRYIVADIAKQRIRVYVSARQQEQQTRRAWRVDARGYSANSTACMVSCLSHSMCRAVPNSAFLSLSLPRRTAPRACASGRSPPAPMESDSSPDRTHRPLESSRSCQKSAHTHTSVTAEEGRECGAERSRVERSRSGSAGSRGSRACGL